MSPFPWCSGKACVLSWCFFQDCDIICVVFWLGLCVTLVARYDPDDYHRQITCGNTKCTKTFGFWMFKVSERREIEVMGVW